MSLNRYLEIADQFKPVKPAQVQVPTNTETQIDIARRLAESSKHSVPDNLDKPKSVYIY